MFIIGAGVAEDVGEDDHIFLLPQRRKFFCEERRRANILQSNGIQHSGSGFKQARRRISRHRFFGETFDHESAEPVEMHDIFELDAIAECSGSGDDRIFQFDAGEADAQVGIARSASLWSSGRLAWLVAPQAGDTAAHDAAAAAPRSALFP